MSHLDLETLARCADGLADEAASEHLAACAGCRAELAALEEQTAALGALPPLAAPRHLWGRIEARLGAAEPDARPVPVALFAPRRPAWRTWIPRAAAGLALFLAGGVAGTMLDGDPPREAEPPARAAEARGSQLAAATDDPEAALQRAAELEAIIRSALYQREALLTQAADEEAQAWF